MSPLPVRRRASSPSAPSSPRQKSRTRVAVLAVPLRPAGREAPDLVAGDVPRLGDHLDRRQDRVLVDQVEEGAVDVHVAALAGEGGGQVEPEAVDVHLGDPVAQGVQDQPERRRVPDVGLLPVPVVSK